MDKSFSYPDKAIDIYDRTSKLYLRTECHNVWMIVYEGSLTVAVLERHFADFARVLARHGVACCICHIAMVR